MPRPNHAADHSHDDPEMLFRIILVDFERNDLQPCPARRKDLPRAGPDIRALVR